METLTQKALKEGKNFIFDNEAFQTSIKCDDIRSAEIGFSPKLDKFWIEFNGKLIHTSKTFKSLMNRLNKLIKDWNLELNRIEQYNHQL